jgi:hypothetical protein
MFLLQQGPKKFGLIALNLQFTIVELNDLIWHIGAYGELNN